MPADDASNSNRPLIQNTASFFSFQRESTPINLGPNDLCSWLRDVGPIAYTLFSSGVLSQQADSLSRTRSSLGHDRPLR